MMIIREYLYGVIIVIGLMSVAVILPLLWCGVMVGEVVEYFCEQ